MADTDGVFVLRDVLLRAVDLYRERSAVICGERSHTWAELAARVHRLASLLRGEGVTRGDRVLLVTPNCLEVVEVAFAVAELAAILVPLSPLAAPGELRRVCADAGASIGFVHPDSRRMVRDAADVRWFGLGDKTYERALNAQPCDEPPLVERPYDTALQLYTSGTTGAQKGVMMSQAALLTNGLNTVLSQGLTDEDVFLTCTPLTHAAGGTRVFSLGVSGITQVILPAWSPSAFFAEVARCRVTVTVLVPSMLRDVAWDPELDAADLSSLRLIVYGAAPTPAEVRAAALARIPTGFLHAYGISEGCPALTALGPEEHAAALADPALAHRLDSVGRPVPGVRFRIVDEGGHEVETGTAGEIQIRNAKRMTGYSRPEEERGLWRDGWMASGDIGYVDVDGYLYIVARKTEMIISGGFNVYPSEVELVLLQHHAIREAAVVGVPHVRWGETPAAFVVTSEAIDDGELLELCRAQLARYKHPTTFIRVDALPRNETGKILKGRLAATLSERA